MIKRGQNICIFSGKGGVGKTITTLNLAGIYETIEKHVLIIDLDLTGGGINVSLNTPAKKTIYNFVDDYNNNRYKDFKDYITPYSKYIDILSSPKDPRQAGKIDSKYIDILLDKAKMQYDVVLIDTNHNLNEINLVTLDKADKILFVIQNDPMDLKNMKTLISIFKDLGITKYKILLNNSRDPYKKYFSLFDMKNIMKANIDYTLSANFYIKDIDQYVMNGKIITLESKMPQTFVKEYATFMNIAADLLESEDKHAKN